MESVARHTEDLALDTNIVRKILVDFLRDEIHNAGFWKGVIGLSGGIDSTVAAYLAAEALGQDNLLGVIMPYRTSSPQSRADAELVTAALGIRFEVMEITPMVEPLLAKGEIRDPVRAGNIMARQRMIVLYDYSQKETALVIGTSNKTEIFLGYGTLFGDTASALNPLGDLYKTQVWQLAKALGVPQGIIEKKPSADLWEGQTDEGELGLSYKQADLLLYYMIDERRSEAELAAMGFSADLIQSVKEKVMKTQFKRRPPLIAKISHRTVNVDFRYPRDWGI